MGKVFFVILALLVVIGGAYLLISTGKHAATPSNTTQSSTTPSATSPSSPSGAMEQTAAVSLTTNGFDPATITVKAGTKVTWTNNSGDSATVNSDPHPIHTDYPPLNLGSFSSGSSLSLVFDKPGTYGYHNHFNPSEKGTIVVTP